MEITVIGFGAWAIGGPWEYGWSTQDDDDSIAVIRKAIESGINWIDTAPAYGLGHSETIISRALADFAVADRPMVFTKCGLPFEAGDTRVRNDIAPDSIRTEVEDSLRRLDTEVLDLYQVHWPIPDSQLESAWEVMAELKEKGRVKHIGASNFSVSQLERCEAIAPVETMQPNYSLLAREIEKSILPWCVEQNLGIISYSPMASGMLSGKMTRQRIKTLPEDDWRKSRSDMLEEPKLSRNLALVDVLKKIADQYDRSAGEVAIAWVLSNAAITGAITGMRRPDQISIVAAGDLKLAQSDLNEIEKFFAD